MHQIIPIPWNEKPRIKLRLVTAHGAYVYPWTCTSPGGSGYGVTPLDAYRRWSAMRGPARAQTVIDFGAVRRQPKNRGR